MGRTFIIAAALALTAAPGVAAPVDQTGMLRASLASSLPGIGSSRDHIAGMSVNQLATLRHIVENGTSEGQKAFRVKSFLARTAN